MTENSEPLRKVFSVTSPARLDVGNIRGSILVQAGAPGEIVVEAVVHPDTGSRERTEIIIEQESDGAVRAKVQYQDLASLFNMGKPCKVDFTIWAPPETNVSASGVSCGVKVLGGAAGLAGKHHIRTVSGDIEIEQLSGALHIKAVSGNVQASSVHGELEANLVSGDLHLANCTLERGEVKTVSGSFSLAGELGKGPFDFNSVSGDVHLTLSTPAGLTASLRSVSGRVRVNAGNGQGRVIERDFGPGRNRETVEVNGGGVPVSLKSVSGSLVLTVPAAAAPASPVAEDQLSKLDVLDKVAKGELTVEDALKQLA